MAEKADSRFGWQVAAPGGGWRANHGTRRETHPAT